VIADLLQFKVLKLRCRRSKLRHRNVNRPATQTAWMAR
jgi:hypothetical protein